MACICTENQDQARFCFCIPEEKNLYSVCPLLT